MNSKFSPPTKEQKILRNGVLENDLPNVYTLTFCTTKEVKLVQFKIIHYTVFTKDKLMKADIIPINDKCHFCKNGRENLEHLLIHCPQVQYFWEHFLKWWMDNTQTKVLLTPTKISYGVIQKCKYKELLNHTLLIAKYFIYKCSLREESLYFSLFEHEVRDKSTKEKNIAIRTNSASKYVSKWQPMISNNYISRVFLLALNCTPALYVLF